VPPYRAVDYTSGIAASVGLCRKHESRFEGFTRFPDQHL